MTEPTRVEQGALNPALHESAEPDLGRRRFFGQSLAAATLAGTGLATTGLSALAAEVSPACIPESPEVTTHTIAETEKIQRLNFTKVEREEIVAGMPAHWAAIDSIRAQPRDRELQPALIFDPRLPGVDYPAQQNSVKLAAKEIPLPAADADIAFASVTAQSRWIRDGKLTSSRLTEIYLRRIARHAPQLYCYITVTADLARRQAEEMDREIASGRWRGPLHGIPYGVKDVFDTAGIPTTWGSSMFKDRVPTEDAAVVTKLREAGAVLLGKQATAELANGATWFGGMGRNPWNPEEPSGGSSTGAGSAVAAALCSFAIGTDSLGSILVPATRCGVVGLRPTFGRVPVKGGMPLTPSLERVGPLCRQVEDAALVLAAINGPDPHSAASINMGFAYDSGIDLSRIKVGYSPRWWLREGFWSDSYLAGAVPIGAAQQSAFDTMKSLGVSMVEVELPALPYGILMKTLEVESAYVFEDLTLQNRDEHFVGNAATWAPMWRGVRMLSAVDYMQIERFRRQVMQVMQGLLTQVDLLFLPTYGLFDLVLITNLTGHPGLSWRAGLGKSATRSLGFTPNDPAGELHTVTQNVCVHGRLFEEGKMLAVARAVEEKQSVWQQRPPLFSS